ncbi:MAG: YHS domain-containing protein [Planctomycetes bacterium]|nr:YHS domain-containing protein [Planctomycetota bacterium]NOG53139.1 YHS domain-containing protein [Planctomycetota bacterium]
MRLSHEERSLPDPVCGMDLSRKASVEELEYKGRVYYFCADVCCRAFKEQPEKYVQQHRQHGIRSE